MERTPSAEAIARRYDLVRFELVPKFLVRHRLTQSGLAQILGVHHSSLSRFLSGAEGHTPAPGRDSKLEMLEKLEILCSKPYVYRAAPPQAGKHEFGPDDDENVWFDNFLQRLGVFAEQFAPAEALAAAPELVAQAKHAPRPYGASMATSLILRLAGHLSSEGAEHASLKLLKDTAERIRRLEGVVYETWSDDFRERFGHRTIGYTGWALLAIGLLLNDRGTLDAGMQRLVRAAFIPHEYSDCHWPNMLGMLERMFEDGHERAEEFSTVIVERARDQWTDNLKRALTACELPRIRDHWKRAAPDILARAGSGGEAGA